MKTTISAILVFLTILNGCSEENEGITSVTYSNSNICIFPNQANVSVGERFQVDVQITDLDQFRAGQIDLVFDHNDLELIEVQLAANSVLGPPSNCMVFSHETTVGSTIGFGVTVAGRIAQGDGPLFTLTLLPLKGSDSRLDIMANYWLDISGLEINQDASTDIIGLDVKIK